MGRSLQFINQSFGVQQLLYRIDLIIQVFKRELSKLGCCDLLALIILDVACGMALSQFLLHFPQLYSILHAQIHQLLSVLLQLLNWLRGSPAGLKLNYSLNSLLWRFFSYHLHLWGNYIGILEPILSFILSTIIWVGPLGLSIQLALIKDLISLGTFHVYCLYIYATRLYRVTVMTVKSLGRLFLGRKWNPLRQRVDHVHLSISELFLGALFFTIVTFLAPTVIVYYLVFLLLRLPVNFVESVLIFAVDFINNLKVIRSFLIMLNSEEVADDIYLKRIDQKENEENSHEARFIVMPLATQSMLDIPEFRFNIVRIINLIMEGKVVS